MYFWLSFKIKTEYRTGMESGDNEAEEGSNRIYWYPAVSMDCVSLTNLRQDRTLILYVDVWCVRFVTDGYHLTLVIY